MTIFTRSRVSTFDITLGQGCQHSRVTEYQVTVLKIYGKMTYPSQMLHITVSEKISLYCQSFSKQVLGGATVFTL
jgi:hypothetical protein